jgi:V/A-type H+-transporting ATPase subunit I
MLVPMAKVEIVGHRTCLDATLACLQSMRVLHIVPASSLSGPATASLAAAEGTVRDAERLRRMRTRLDALVRLTAGPPTGGDDDAGLADLDAVEAELERLAPDVERRVARIDDLQSEQAVLPRHIESLRRLLPLVPELLELASYETVALLVDRRHAEVIDLLRRELVGLLGAHFEIISGSVDAHTIGAVVVFPASESRRVHSVLSREQVSRVNLPERFRGLALGEAISAMERRLVDLPAELERERADLAASLGPAERWRRARAEIDRRLARLDALRDVGATERAFVVVGWVPRSHVDALGGALRDRVGKEVLLVEIAAAVDEEPPVLLENPAPARPFQSFVGLLALPRYGTIDPTVLMAIFLPLFFGIMLGDIAYGAALLGLSVWAHRRFAGRSPIAGDITRILGYGAAWAVVWGFVFGEFLGDLGHRLFDLRPIWIYREEAIQPLLLFAIAIGAAHVVLGLVLGIFVSARSRSMRLLGERAALLTALSGLFMIAGVAAERLPSGLMTPAVVAVVVGLVVLVAARWPLGLVTGPLDLIGVISNVLSYLRIAAIGLASVFLARVANELGATAPLWLGIAIAALFHALNLALGAFSPTIQALRLHYVEFFDKFYEPGGEPFSPFGSSTVPVTAAASGPPATIGTRRREHT